MRYKHVDDISLHIYIHTYIHTYIGTANSPCYSCIQGLLRLAPNYQREGADVSVRGGTAHAIPPNYNHTMLGLACHTPQSQGEEEGWGAGGASSVSVW